MQDHGEDRRERGLAAADARPEAATATGAYALATAEGLRVGEVVSRNVVTLPAWFPIAKARAVLQLKGMPFALLSDARGVQAVVHVDDLATAPSERSLSGCATPLGPAISAQLPIEEALRFMNRHAAVCVPVVLGGVLLGVLSHATATAALAAHGQAALPLAA